MYLYSISQLELHLLCTNRRNFNVVDESEVPVPVCTASMSKRRSFIDQLTPAPKKKCSAESQLQTKELEFQTRAKESEVGMLWFC